MDASALLLTLRARALEMTFKELARRTGLNRETLYRTLSRTGNPRMATLVVICEALGVKLRVRVAARDYAVS